MSHFTVLVVAKDVAAALQPFHEFECTGVNDQYIQEVDITDECREGFAVDTKSMVRFADGRVRDRTDDACYREFTPEEAAKAGRPMGSGYGGGLSWTSKDWGDGKGYRAKVWALPEGATEIQQPFATFADWYEYHHNAKQLLIAGAIADFEGDHKYGFAQLDEAGNLVRAVDRTNPNKKWDWWQVGGRWRGKLRTKDGRSVDEAAAGDVDFDAMIAAKAEEAGEQWDAIRRVVAGRQVTTWDQLLARVRAKEISLDEARTTYSAQPVLSELDKAGVLRWFDGGDTLSAVLSTERAVYVEREGALQASTWALLHEGEWTERGEMGWFACSDATDESTKAQTERFWSVLRALPPDAYLTVVDCHI